MFLSRGDYILGPLQLARSCGCWSCYASSHNRAQSVVQDVEVVAVLPHPMSSPDVASPAYYYFKSISTDREIPPSEVANFPAIAGLAIEVSYDGKPLPHVGTIFPEENNGEEQSLIRPLIRPKGGRAKTGLTIMNDRLKPFSTDELHALIFTMDIALNLIPRNTGSPARRSPRLMKRARITSALPKVGSFLCPNHRDQGK
jgi:hypothetical protein